MAVKQMPAIAEEDGAQVQATGMDCGPIAPNVGMHGTICIMCLTTLCIEQMLAPLRIGQSRVQPSSMTAIDIVTSCPVHCSAKR